MKKEGLERLEKQEKAVLRKLREKMVYKKILDPVAPLPEINKDSCLFHSGSYVSPSLRNTARVRSKKL